MKALLALRKSHTSKATGRVFVDLSSPIHALHLVPGKKPATRAMDVANAILFLASDQASMINGVSLPIDQAWSTI